MALEESELTEEQRAIKEEFKAECGYWYDGFDDLLQFDHEFLKEFGKIASHPHKEGPLDPKTKQLLYIAINAAPTHLYSKGIRKHIGMAFDHGVTTQEITEVIEMVTALGIHSITTGVPILADEMGVPEDFDEETEREHERIREQFKQKRGYWDERREMRMKFDHKNFEYYTDFSAHPWETGDLDPKTREFIYVAIDAATTHVYEYGIRVHLQNAIDHGATREEVLEVFQIASTMGIQSVVEAMPILAEEAQSRGKLD